MLKRYQVLLSDWLAEHIKAIAEKYDFSFSEAIRIALTIQIMELIQLGYPNYKAGASIKDMKEVIRMRKNPKNWSPEKLHRIFSKIYFEGHKAAEFWMEKEKQKKNSSPR